VAHLFVIDDGTLVEENQRLSGGRHRIWLEVDGTVDVSDARVLLGWEADDGGTWSSASPIR